jgi:hypothetical protein
MQRTIEIADFELPRGPVPIAKLMALPQESWDHLRNEISRRRQVDPSRPLARCRLCRGAVFIRSRFVGDAHHPMFAHYADAPDDCPWHHGPNITPDDARAAQYKGQQESAHHLWMCETIADLIARDSRARSVAIETYRRPEIHARGRFPDVYAEIDGLGQFAIEVQLSKPFAPEIVARQLFYEAEGVNLLWVFAQLDPEPPQGFRDVIALQRGNAFLFDEAALAASIAANGLRLNCLRDTDGGGWLKPKIVSLDDLDRSGRAVFLEDRRTERLLAFCRSGRDKWWDAFNAAPPEVDDKAFLDPAFGAAWDSIKGFVPGLVDWKRTLWTAELVKGDQLFGELAAILFSIAHSAAAGSDVLHITRYKNEGRLVAMLNSKLSSAFLAPFATVIEAMLEGTKMRERLSRASLQQALAQAKAAAPQVQPGHAVWDGVTRLFPEVFDGLKRAELLDLERLPEWAE